MQYMIYHKTGERKIVGTVEKELLISSGEWFSNPDDAKSAVNKDKEEIKKKFEQKKVSK